MEYDKTVSGIYLNPAASVTKFLSLPFQPDWFESYIIGTSLSTGTNWASVANPGVVKSVKWFRGMVDGTALALYNTAGAATDVATMVTTLGIAPYSSNPTLLGAPVAITGVSKAAAAVVAAAGHTFVDGDVVLIRGTTAMLQVSTIPYVIANVVAGVSFTIPVNSTGFANAGTAGFAQKVLFPDVYQPDLNYITNITAANPAVVTLARNTTLAVGDEVRFIIPPEWGMVELNGRSGFVTAAATNSVSVAIDTSAMTAFSYTTSAIAATGVSFPQVVPIGEIAGSFAGSFADYGTQGLIIGSTVVGANATYVAWKAGMSAKVYTP